MALIILFIFSFFIIPYLGNKTKEKNLEFKNYNISLYRNLMTNRDKQNLNNIINIYNPYNKVTYISSQNNQNGDLFILTNSESSNKRIVYALKSDATNYFSDNSYKIFDSEVNTSIYGYNRYPMITPIKMKNNENLVSFSHEGCFEGFDLKEILWFPKVKNKLIIENSLIAKNTFIYLKNYENYILKAYIAKGKDRLYIYKIYFKNINFTKYTPKISNETMIEGALKTCPVTCFENNDLIVCLYANSNFFYTISIFEIYNFNLVYNTTIDINTINSEELFSKCIYFKENIGAFIYFLDINSFPILTFKKLNKLNCSTFDYELVDYFGPISININNTYNLGNSYIYNDIIRMNNNSLAYISTDEESEIIIIILIILLNNDKNALLNYFKIDLKNLYNLKIYKDITIFKLKGFLGIGMTHYNFTSSETETYSSYFIIGMSSFNQEKIIEENDVFDEENIYILNTNSLEIKIENNLFGYSSNGLRIISKLSKKTFGFYLYSNNNNKLIKSNEILSFSEEIIFKLVNESCVKKQDYSIIFESVISEPSYNDLISLADSVEYFPTNNTDLNSYYEPKELYGKRLTFSFSVVNCYKTCQSCSCYGNNYNHSCLNCSSQYPYLYNEEGFLNCLESCPENYIPDNNNLCILKVDTTIIENNDTGTTDNLSIETAIIENSDSSNTDFLNPNPTVIKNNNSSCSNNGKNKIINEICFENYYEISKYIKNISDNHIIMNVKSNSNIYGYEIRNESEEYCIGNNLIYIDLLDSLNEIRNKFNLGNETNIYLLIIDIPYNYSGSSINDFSFVLLLENGTELNISEISNLKVDISIPILDLDSLNYDYAIYFAKQGYDIYNSSSSFYTDLCSPANLGKNDITLKDRQSEIYPNNINKNNCSYKNVDLNSKRFSYECQIVGDYSSVIDEEEDFQDNNFFTYFLDLINYKILICNNIFYDLKYYKNNVGLIVCLVDLFLSIPLILIYLIWGIQKIRIDMHNEIQKSKKIIHQIIKKNYNNIIGNSSTKILNNSSEFKKKKSK